MIGLARVNYPKRLIQAKVPTLLIYATFESIDEKAAKKTKKLVQRLERNSAHIHTYGIDGRHYLHWERPETIEKIKSWKK